jgi:hypothetical protein
MKGKININVSAVDYDKTSKALTRQLSLLEEMVHFWLAFFCFKCKQIISRKIDRNDGIRF